MVVSFYLFKMTYYTIQPDNFPFSQGYGSFCIVFIFKIPEGVDTSPNFSHQLQIYNNVSFYVLNLSTFVSRFLKDGLLWFYKASTDYMNFQIIFRYLYIFMDF